ncbi:MAG: hypothetical protein EXS03_07855 [Phycisphaerales bacterium]|nr:hypothetical protein [Phycisphaerales bacterium]
MDKPPIQLSFSREVEQRARQTIGSPSGSLIAAGAAAAGSAIAPLGWSLGTLAADGLSPLGQSPALDELWTQMTTQAIVLAAQSVWVAVLAVPLCYGATLVALREVRGDPPCPSDLWAAYRRPGSFAVFLAILALLAIVPLVLWIVCALIAGAAIGVTIALASEDAEQASSAVTLTVIAIGVPFLVASLYFQCRLLFTGVALLDPRLAGQGLSSALGRSWRITKGRDGALTRISLVAAWEFLRGVTIGLVVGLFTRGIPAFFGLLAATFDVAESRASGLPSVK